MERSCHRTINLTRHTVKHDSFAPYDFKSFVIMLSVLWTAYIKSLNKTVLLIQCQCSVSCGQGIKKRNVTCDAADPTEKCDSRAVPISWAYCSEGVCPVITLPPTTMVSRLILLKSPFEEQFSVKCRQFSGFHRSCHTSLRDWLRKLSPFSQPIRCKRKINCDLIIHVFPRLTQFSFSTSNSHRLDRIFPFASVC